MLLLTLHAPALGIDDLWLGDSANTMSRQETPVTKEL